MVKFESMKSFFLMVLISTCVVSLNAQNSIIGDYETCEASAMETLIMVAKGANGFVQGSTLSLKKDGSYKMMTCGNIITGRWKVNGKKIVLTALNSRWRNDSLHAKYGMEKSSYKVVYNIASDGKLWCMEGKTKGEIYCTLFCKRNN